MCVNRDTSVRLESHWSRWASFGPKGMWEGHHEEPPSADTFSGILAALHGQGQRRSTATQLTEGHAREFRQTVAAYASRHREKVSVPHVQRFFAARSAEEKRCLRGMLADGESTAISPLPLISSYKSEKSLCGAGFNEAVHGSIDDAVEGRAEFSPEAVLEHLQSGSDTGAFTTATAHTLCMKLKGDAVDQINMDQHHRWAREEARRRAVRGLSSASSLITAGNFSAVVNKQVSLSLSLSLTHTHRH